MSKPKPKKPTNRCNCITYESATQNDDEGERLATAIRALPADPEPTQSQGGDAPATPPRDKLRMPELPPVTAGAGGEAAAGALPVCDVCGRPRGMWGHLEIDQVCLDLKAHGTDCYRIGYERARAEVETLQANGEWLRKERDEARRLNAADERAVRELGAERDALKARLEAVLIAIEGRQAAAVSGPLDNAVREARWQGRAIGLEVAATLVRDALATPPAPVPGKEPEARGEQGLAEDVAVAPPPTSFDCSVAPAAADTGRSASAAPAPDVLRLAEEALIAARGGIDEVRAQAGLCLIHVGVAKHQQEWFRKEVAIIANSEIAAIDRALVALRAQAKPAPLEWVSADMGHATAYTQEGVIQVSNSYPRGIRVRLFVGAPTLSAAKSAAEALVAAARERGLIP